ncbi:methyl-accepting chemotaxis protein [Amphibacillus sp. MSJ-3]|uniref:methyl-accepting chemotaxis protein n=1 Tax=Amphibacillus sp. MSJ-3 TaxID=2841505 RepID=UPI0035302C79
MFKPLKGKKDKKMISISYLKRFTKRKKDKQKKQRFGKFGLHNLSIGWKYGSVLIFIFILLVISTMLVSASIKEAKKDMEILNSQADRAILTIELSDLIQSKGLSAMGYVQFGSESHLDEFEAKNEEIAELLTQLDALVVGDQQISLYNEIMDHNQQLDDMFYEEIITLDKDDEKVMRLYSNRYNNLTATTSLYLEYLRDLMIESRDLAAENASSSQNFAQIVLVSSMVISFVIAFIIIVLISRHVTKQLRAVVTMSDRIASGDLTDSEIHYQGKDEIGRLSRSIDQMRLQLTFMIDSIKQTSLLVGNQSEQLNQSSDDVKSGTEQIAATMEELASGTETQANFASDLAGTMKDFAEKISSINESSETINTSSNDVLKETSLGNEYMDRSIKQMDSIDHIVKDAVIKVEGLDKQSQQISQLVAVIKDIADQTNLLALNAAIEAARAGEQGLGFAVVADEVRKLAEQVNESVVDITDIVETIQTESQAVSTALKQGYNEVTQGTEDIEATGIRFKAIEEAISTMTAHVQTVMAGLADLNNDSEKVNEAVQEIASISEESAAGVEETSASAEEASSAMEGVANGASTLLESARELSELVQQFKME